MLRINSFEPVARQYSSKVAPRRFSQFLTLVHELELRGHEKVLDIGSGPGELSVQIAHQLEAGGFLHGIDLSPSMLRLARKIAATHGRKNVVFKKGDALDLPYKDGIFDIVVSSNAFPWVPDRPAFLKEVYRVLRPGGRFGLVALSNTCYREFSEALKRISKENPKLIPPGKPFELMGAKLHTVHELGKLVGKVGFEIIRRFSLATEEPITPSEYVDRVNAIVNENYLSHLKTEEVRRTARQLIQTALAGRNGELRVTESSVFVISSKPAVVDS